MGPVRVLPRPLAEIVQWLLQQQHQQQKSAHNCPNDTPAAPQLLAATESLRGWQRKISDSRWRNDAATLESLRELTTLDLSACTISSYEGCSRDQYKERWASDNLSILLECMPQLTSLDLRNSLRGPPHNPRQVMDRISLRKQEAWYRDEICDAGLLEAIGKLTSLQVLRLGAVSLAGPFSAPTRRTFGRSRRTFGPRGPARDQDPDRRAAGWEGSSCFSV